MLRQLLLFLTMLSFFKLSIKHKEMPFIKEKTASFIQDDLPDIDCRVFQVQINSLAVTLIVFAVGHAGTLAAPCKQQTQTATTQLIRGTLSAGRLTR